MRVTVLYFGVLQDLFERKQEVVELPAEMTVETFLRFSEGRSSKKSQVWRTLAVAVNQEYAQAGVVLAEGDEVALLPPVSGGSIIK